ncbi:hypothetical protein [Sphingomonas sp.]|jgi:hypothetical protein|uniref:hypothetical protein n=1 Tax=Sphingomonas sp. TaxID=28214 RepID=UPI00262004A3|nr:hypothetical protein [Sphingomonas sp.]MDF2494975.1 hypothetical protein [Sphingomonas sp.]
MIRRTAAALLLGAANLAPTAAPAGQSAPGPAAALAGDYVSSQMELVARLRLSPDGTFRYGLTVGSLDETAQGRWRVVGEEIELTSDPRPRAPTVEAAAVENTPAAPFGLRVLAPNGQDVPGVDFVIEFDRGEPLSAYTPGDRWVLPTDEHRTPRFVTFAMPRYRLQSARLPLDGAPGRTAIFRLVPNDFGVADLTGARLTVEGDTLTLHREEGTLRFRRAAR